MPAVTIGQRILFGRTWLLAQQWTKVFPVCKKVKVRQGDHLPLSSRSQLQNIPTQGRNFTFLQDRNAMFSQVRFSVVIADRGW